MAGPEGKKTAALVRPCLNTLLMMDVMSGSYVRGKDGVWYLNGGLHAITGYAGRGNTFKTAFSSYNLITACIRYSCEYTEIYDTEMSYQISRANTFARLVPGAGHIDFNDKILDGSFNIVSSIELPGDEWWKVICNEYDKRRKIKSGLRETPFYDFDGSVIKMLDPWLYLVDSMTMLKTSNIAEIEEKNVVGASTLQTMAMRSAGAKSQLISQMPIVTGGAGIYLSMVAHAGDGIKLDQYAPSNKKLSGLKGDIKLKGVPENFSFLTNNCFIATASKSMLDSKKMPEYRRRVEDKVIVGDTDLMIIRFEQLRGKGGPTGRCLDIIFSQAEGLQATLSEFYHLNKIIDSFGIEVIGNNAKFRLHLYPEVTFTRNSIRELIASDPKFCRAMELTYELGNLTYNNPWQFKDIMLDCEQLKAGIEAQGIEWDKILTDTVYYWYLADQKYRECTMTIPTLLEIAAGIHKDKRLAKIKPLVPKAA